MADKIIETEYDIGLSAGRNRLLDMATTPFVFFADDDHQVTKRTHLRGLVDELIKNEQIDLLATLSSNVGRPRLLKVEGRTLRIPRGFYHASGPLRWCHFVSNCFVAYRDILSAVRWDETLKMEEHWDFFWRAKLAGVKVAVNVARSFRHRHIDPPGYHRRRPEFRRASLKKHGLKRVIWH
ncbi:glycosyltransferase family 2 protein [Bremerella cremea]|nr:glycosyltransferase [Bremerella cremea]